MFLQHKADRIDILSGLFEIHFVILFYFTYCIILLMMLSAVCKCQVTTFCRVVPEYGFCIFFGSRILRCLIDFLKICAIMI